MQRSRSRPTRPTHWLGSGALAPALELVLPPIEVLGLVPGNVVLGSVLPGCVVEPGLVVEFGLVVELGALLLVLEPALDPVEPEALVCAHETLATPTNAAATATAIVLTITMRSPES